MELNLDNEIVKTVNGYTVIAEAKKSTMTSFSVTSEDELNGTTYDLVRVHEKIKALEGMRKAITKPLDEAKKRVMELFHRPIDILIDIEKVMKSSVLDYKLNAHSAAQTPDATQVRTVRKARVSNMFKLLAFVVKNPQHINLIEINHKALMEAAQSGMAEYIDGIEFYEDKILAVTSKESHELVH
jgi:hypothetical protein